MKRVVTLLCIFFALMILAFPRYCTDGMKTGVNVCLYTLLPSFFPFLVITNFLTQYNLFETISSFIHPVLSRLFSVSKAGSYVILVGFMCGYPIGIKTAMDMYDLGQISDTELKFLIKFCNNPSLPFVINYVIYTLLNNQSPAPIVLFSLYGASLLTGLIFCLLEKKKHFSIDVSQNIIATTINTPKSLTTVFLSAFKTLASLSAYVLVFSVAISYLENMLKTTSIFKMITILFTEITTGVGYISNIDISYNLKMYLIIIALMSGGLSITFQTFGILKSKELLLEYLKGKAVSIVLSSTILGAYFIWML